MKRATILSAEALSSGDDVVQIVATPSSGTGRALDRAVQIQDALRARGHRVRLETFPELGAVRRWATSRTSFSFLICVGGDGTLETAAAAAVRRAIPFLAVSSGFGNLFARALGQPERVDQVVDLVERGEVALIDVGVRNDRPFICHESFGLLAQIQDLVEANSGRLPRGRWRRSLAYCGTALRHLRQSPLTSFHVTVDGRAVSRDAAIVVVANVETFGPWLNLTPAASPIDGLFDVFVMERTTKREILARLIKLWLHLPGAGNGTLVRRGRRISVSAAPHQSSDEIHLLPRQLPVVVSSETAAALERHVGSDRDFAESASRRVA